MICRGSLENEPGAQNHEITDKEGTVTANGQKGKDAGTVAKTGATGAVIGTVASRTATGAGIGGLAGAAVGLGEVLITRGQDVRIEQGTALEMVLQRALVVDVTHTDSAGAENNVGPSHGQSESPSKFLQFPRIRSMKIIKPFCEFPFWDGMSFLPQMAWIQELLVSQHSIANLQLLYRE